MSDGSRLRQSWTDGLNEAESRFRALLASPSVEWRHIQATQTDAPPSPKGKGRAPEISEVVVHRKVGKSGDDVYRVVLEIPTGDEPVSLEPWKAVLSTPELRKEWDPAVESARLVEMFDHTTRICKTNFTLGWPANPRDAVTISRSFQDSTTVIDISTSLPRSLDEPSYLRPSPPYVRSNVSLFAWCIQYFPPSEQGGRLKLTCFWHHDLRAVWNFGSAVGLSQQLCTMILGLHKTVQSRGSRVPVLTGYGHGVSIERVKFQVDREALTVDYAIIPEEETPHSDELSTMRKLKRLTRSIECLLPSSDGWEVQLTTKASSKEVEDLPWSARAVLSTEHSQQVVFNVAHAPLIDDTAILKVRLVIEFAGASSGLRLNGLAQSIQALEERDPTPSYFMPQLLQDASSIGGDASIQTTGSSIATADSGSMKAPFRERTAAADKSILSRVRRNYIYFSSLLQEPEAKWRRTTEARGVSITQLDSIDPTLVVYRAEATFVGVGLWDLYGSLVTPGARSYWDKQHEDAVLLEDVNELTELWHFKTKPAWPVVGRDSVVLKTVYKSPTTIHVFSFSAEDAHIFPNIPPADPTVIRTQVDLQGWAIEALSPTTTLLTLLEQSDPKGWTNKATIPQQMINAVAGVGEFTIKCGGPPVVTRLGGGKANQIRYDHERGMFRMEYESSASRRTPPSKTSTVSTIPLVECELRCDVDTWASTLDIVVDPPPQSITCLRRHRLSAGGGGLWLTLSHDALFVDDERLLAIVRRGPVGTGKDKGLVMVNGARVNVDVEELPESEIKSLTKRKRVKPPRIPLDQPPVMGAIRKRRAEWDVDTESPTTPTKELGSPTSWATAPRFSSPLSRFITSAVESATTATQDAVAAISPATAPGEDAVPSSSKLPMQYALEALSWIQESQPRMKSNAWTLVSDKGISVHRRLAPEISPTIPVHKGEKVIEGISAEELAMLVGDPGLRKQWDDRFDSSTALETFGSECHTSYHVSKGGFPFRDRGFYLASVMARDQVLARDSSSSAGRNVIYRVSASFSPESVSAFSAAKYNPYVLPTGRVFVDAWMFETLDPYTTENYAIPSTRCTRVVAVDYAGAIPAAVNSMINATLPRSILAIEVYVKSMTAAVPLTRLPPAGLVVSDKKHDEPFFAAYSWKVKRRDERRALVSTEYVKAERVYTSVILLREGGGEDTGAASPRPSRMFSSPPGSPDLSLGGGTSPLTTPTLAGLSPIPSLSAAAMSSVPSVLSSPATSPRARTVSSTSTSVRLRPTPSAFTLKGEVRHSTDLVVGEIVVDSKLYPDGYDVRVRSSIQDDDTRLALRPTLVDGQQVLPIVHTVHTMPASPLHSSGLGTGPPTRHLVRLTLPTAQYTRNISTANVQDPLTGETRSAPAKPQWYLDLQDKGAIVCVEVRPRAGGVVSVDGKEVVVSNEKESLTILGRDDLMDERVSRMPVISRVPAEAEVLPEELMVSLAVAIDMLEPPLAPSSIAVDPDNKKTELIPPTTTGQEDPGVMTLPHAPAPPEAVGGLMGFLHLNSNPLARLSAPGGLMDFDVATTTSSAASMPRYTLATVVFVATIAFLVGSLFRSLLSPADFVYVVKEGTGDSANAAGWRELKRLLELKFGRWDLQLALVRRP